MLRWLSFASLAAIVVLTLAAKEDRALFGDCRAYPIVKSFTMNRITSNDSCTFGLPTFQCGGFCETTAELTPRPRVVLHSDGMYELIPRVNCKCCEPVESTMKTVLFPAGTISCEGSGLKWDKKLILHRIHDCTCRKCRSSLTVSG